MDSGNLYVIARYLIVSLLILPAKTLPSALKHDIKPRSISIEDLVECYGLPYGGIGFLSHILTYYTIICVGAGQRPLAPWLRLRHSHFDIFLAIISLIGTVVITIYTGVRCRGEWQIVLLAISKLALSLTLGIVVLHSCINIAE
jgi:hypothetical protein